MLLVVAVLSSSGAHWLVLQSIAWTAMIVARSSETTLVSAVKQTLSGEQPCSLCRTVRAGMAGDQQHDEAPPLVAKIELFYEAAPLLLPPQRTSYELSASPLTGPLRSEPPPLQPPRAC